MTVAICGNGLKACRKTNLEAIADVQARELRGLV